MVCAAYSRYPKIYELVFKSTSMLFGKWAARYNLLCLHYTSMINILVDSDFILKDYMEVTILSWSSLMFLYSNWFVFFSFHIHLEVNVDLRHFYVLVHTPPTLYLLTSVEKKYNLGQQKEALSACTAMQVCNRQP